MSMTEPTDGDVRDRVVALLADGPVPLADVVADLEGRGLLAGWRDEGVADADLGRALIDEVLDTDEIWVDAGEEHLALADLLTDGMVLTHRLTGDEADSQQVGCTPDLVVLDWNAPDGLVLDGLELDGPSGGRVDRVYGETVPGEDRSVFVGPEGWLDGFAAGDVLAFTRSGPAVRVDRAPALGDGSHEVSLLRDAVDARIAPGRGEEAVPLVLDALIADPGAFRQPVRPLGELLAGAGLERRGFSFGRAGEDWASFGEQVLGGVRSRVAQRWGLGWCCQQALERAHRALAAFDPGDPPAGEAARALADDLSHDMVAPALFEDERLTGPGDRARVAAFAAWIVEAEPRRAEGAHMVLGLCAEMRGDASGAEAAFRAALRTDPGYSPASVELAQYEVDRGHLDRAVTLMRHPDLEEESKLLPVLEAVRRAQAAPYRGVGRNDPCPCGSGRRFKACCQRDPRPSVAAVHQMLGLKLALFCGRDHRRSKLVGLASSACDPDDPDLLDQLRAIMADPFIGDVALYEGGVGEDYLAERGDLLPAAERQLLEASLDEPRLLWEVRGVAGGDVLTLHHPASGAPVEAASPLAQTHVEAGDTVLARVVPVDGGHQVVGAVVRVPAAALDSARDLLAGYHDADGLAAWWGEHIGPEAAD